MKIALIGGVSSTWYTLDALIRAGVDVTGVLGVDESRAEAVSDYRALRPLAEGAGIPFRSFIKVSEPELESFLLARRPDLIWVIGLSQLVPDSLINIASGGGVGFHPTMLPEGRGRAPVAWTILLGARAAANLFYLTDEPDAGDIIMQREVPVLPDDYSEELIQRTNEVLAEGILELGSRIKAGNLPRVPQDNSKATYYAKRTPADGLIDWTATTDKIYRLIRAAGRPYPGAFTHVGDRKLTVWRARPSDDTASDAPPGYVSAIDLDEGVLIATGNGGIWMTKVVVEGGGNAADLLTVGMQLA
jgi:methionyl-tRNA formyltransferase